MKRIIIAGIALLLTSQIFAQQEERPKPPPPEKRWEKDSQKIGEALTLPLEQMAKLKTVFFGFYQEMDGLHNKYQEGRPPKEEMELHDKRNEEVKKVLTPEQYVKFAEVSKQLGPPKRRQGGPKAPTT